MIRLIKLGLKFLCLTLCRHWTRFSLYFCNKERYLNLAILPTPSTALAIQSTFPQGRGKGFKQGHARLYSHCGRTNHIVDTCFAKHGLSPGWKSKKAVNQIFASPSKEHDVSATSESFVGLSKDQIENSISFLPNAKLIAIERSTNLVDSYNISSQPSSGKM